MLSFLSKDSENEKVFFRTDYEIKDNTYLFPDKSVGNTMIHLTVENDLVIFERKGDINMHMELLCGKETSGHYENNAGLSFPFKVRCNVITKDENKLHLEYDLFVMGDKISNHKIWISF